MQEEDEGDIGYEDIDHEMIMAQIKGHDPKFDPNDRAKLYKEIVYFFKPAMNAQEEEDYDAIEVETYVVLTQRFFYCVDLENLEWLFDPVPVEKIASMQLSLSNTQVAIFKRL